jgi:Fur family ferric uptake transcriptional regulator
MKRKTYQREAITLIFEREKRPLTIPEIVEAGREIVPSLNQATVYRNLNRLIQEGQLQKVQPSKPGGLYELAKAEHHHYFHCRKCNRSFEIPGCGLRQKGAVGGGFIIEDHKVFLFGVCQSCSC